MFKLLFKNSLQRNFQAQMKEVERDLKKKAKKGEGLFTNNIFKLRFYGYSDTGERKQNIFYIIGFAVFKFMKAIIFFLAWVIGITIFVLGFYKLFELIFQ